MSSRNLPPPMRPTTSRYSSDEENRHGSLSDYSDYESSDEEAHNRASSSGAHQGRKPYVTVSDDEFDSYRGSKRSIPQEEERIFCYVSSFQAISEVLC